MITETVCPYCEQLPTCDVEAVGHKIHCPLCKSDVLVAANGRTYRVVDTPPRKHRLREWLRSLASVLPLVWIVLALPN